MSRYPLNLPNDLKREAEEYAQKQGVSLNQFILWSVAEKVGQLRQALDDPNFPEITYKRGASGVPMPPVKYSNTLPYEEGGTLRVRRINGCTWIQARNNNYWEPLPRGV
jgi:hypothetical protein